MRAEESQMIKLSNPKADCRNISFEMSAHGLGIAVFSTNSLAISAKEHNNRRNVLNERSNT